MKVSVLGSGSKGNSTLIEFENKKVLIDVGFSYKYIKEKLSELDVTPQEIDYIFISHDHSDHIYGLEVFLKRNCPILCINENLPVKYIESYENKVDLNKDMVIDNISVSIIQTSHDSPDSKGFIFEEGDESLVHITDTGYINQRYFKLLKNRTYYVVESNHDIPMLMSCRYPHMIKQRIYGPSGHLSNQDSAACIARLIGDKTKKVVLAHISENSNTEEIALATLEKTLKEKEIECSHVSIEAAKQREVVKVND